MSGREVDNQYRHCRRGSSVERPITFHVSILNVTSLRFRLGIIINSLNKNKRLFIKHGVPIVTEMFLFDVNIHFFTSLDEIKVIFMTKI